MHKYSVKFHQEKKVSVKRKADVKNNNSLLYWLIYIWSSGWRFEFVMYYINHNLETKAIYAVQQFNSILR